MGDEAIAKDVDDTERPNPSESGDLGSSAPEADWPEVDPRRLREAGLGRANEVAPPQAKALGGVLFPPALILCARGDSVFPAISARVLVRSIPGNAGRGRSERLVDD